MKKQLLIKEKQITDVHLLNNPDVLVVLSKGAITVYSNGTYEKLAVSRLIEPLFMCMDDREEHAYIVTAEGALFKYSMEDLLAGGAKPVRYMDQAFGIMQATSLSLHWVQRDIIYARGTYKDVIIDLSKKQKMVLYDEERDGCPIPQAATYRVFDDQSKTITAVVQSDRFAKKRDVLELKDFDLEIPIEYVAVNAQKYRTLYLEGFQLKTEKQLKTLLRKYLGIQVKGKDISHQAELPDKRYQAALNSANIMHTAFLDQRMLIIQSKDRMVFIEIRKEGLNFSIIPGGVEEFRPLDETSMLLAATGEGVYRIVEI